jgi:hypothetical protein
MANETAVSASLSAATVRGAIGFAAGRTAAGVVPASVALLTEGVLGTMTTLKLKVAAMAVLTIGLAVGGAGVFARQEGPAREAGNDPKREPPAAPNELDGAALRPRARRLLQEARQQIRLGHFDDAATRIKEADDLDVRYGLFDDSPQKAADALRRAMSNGAPAERSPFAAEDQEARLRGLEQRLTRLAEQMERFLELAGREDLRPRSAPRDEEDRWKRSLWDLCLRDGLIGRYDTPDTTPETFVTELSRRYLGRRPTEEELLPLMKPFGLGGGHIGMAPEAVLRRVFDDKAFQECLLRAAMLRSQVSKSDVPSP